LGQILKSIGKKVYKSIAAGLGFPNEFSTCQAVVRQNSRNFIRREFCKDNWVFSTLIPE